jgi:tetratricopeptide (TPR) repeat protein
MTRFKSKLIVLTCFLVLTGSRNNDLGIYPCSLGDQKSVDAILQRTEKTLKSNPDDLDEMFQRSYALFVNGQINEGLALCEKLITKEKTFRSRDLHYRILKRTGDFEGSLQDVSTFMSTEKEVAFLYTCQFLKATFLYRLDRIPEAIKQLENIEKDLNSDAEVFYLKALCYKKLNYKAKELEALEKAILVGSNIGQYRLSRATLTVSKKDQCLRDLDTFIEINTKNTKDQNIRPQYLFTFGKAASLFLEMGDTQRALELCRMGIAQGEEKYELWKVQAQALIKMKKMAEAKAVIAQAEVWLDEQNALLASEKEQKQ